MSYDLNWKERMDYLDDFNDSRGFNNINHNADSFKGTGLAGNGLDDYTGFSSALNSLSDFGGYGHGDLGRDQNDMYNRNTIAGAFAGNNLLSGSPSSHLDYNVGDSYDLDSGLRQLSNIGGDLIDSSLEIPPFDTYGHSSFKYGSTDYPYRRNEGSQYGAPAADLDEFDRYLDRKADVARNQGGTALTYYGTENHMFPPPGPLQDFSSVSTPHDDHARSSLSRSLDDFDSPNRSLDSAYRSLGLGTDHYYTPYSGSSADYSDFYYEPLFPTSSYSEYSDNAAFQDLLMFQNQLDSNTALSESDRLQRWQDRLAFEDLADADKRTSWSNFGTKERIDLGLDHYYGSLYDDPGHFERLIQPGWSASEGFLSASYALSSPVLDRYSTYFDPAYATDRSLHRYVDSDYLAASDLAAFSNALKMDQSLAEAERQRRWAERLAFEELEEAERARRYRQMAETQRIALGLSSEGFASLQYYDFDYRRFFDPARLESPRLPLTSDLREIYRPFISRDFTPSVFKSRDWELAGAYYDLLRFENELRKSRLNSIERDILWKNRLAWQRLDEASRRAKWMRMNEQQKRILGLQRDRYFGFRYGALAKGYGFGGRWVDPRLARQTTLRYALSPSLERRFQPYKGRTFQITNRPTWLTSASASANLARQTLPQGRLEAQKGYQTADREQLNNLSLAQLKDRERRSKEILDRLDHQRMRASGHQTGAHTWRAPGTFSRI